MTLLMQANSTHQSFQKKKKKKHNPTPQHYNSFLNHFLIYQPQFTALHLHALPSSFDEWNLALAGGVFSCWVS